MRAFGDVVYALPGAALRIGLLLLTLAQCYVCLLALARRRRPAYTAFTLLHLLGAFVLLLLMLDGTYDPGHLPERTVLPAAVARVYAQPWALYAALEAVSAAATALCYVSDARFVKCRPSPDSVKEALDDLPVGVCFMAEDGTAAMANLRMNEWCHLLTGLPLVNGTAFLRAIEKAGERGGGNTLLRFPDGTALQFDETEVTVDGKRYRQLTATDLTEQYRVTARLEENNAKLRDITVRMKAYSVELTDLVMDREKLNARVTLHDEVGHVLLRAKHYFDHPEEADAAALYELLLRTNEFLLHAADESPEREDPLTGAVQLAKGIGVTVTCEGPAPENGALRGLIGQAVRECAMNAVKHADGDRLLVSFTPSAYGLTVTLSANGRPAASDVVPTGGLKSLNAAVLAAGGTMRTETEGEFTVVLTLPG